MAQLCTAASSSNPTPAAAPAPAPALPPPPPPPLPQVQVEAGEGTEILVKQRVKLMSLDPEKKWKDRGQGTLTLRRAVREDASAKRPYFVFTTDSGARLVGRRCMPWCPALLFALLFG